MQFIILYNCHFTMYLIQFCWISWIAINLMQNPHFKEDEIILSTTVGLN